MLSHQVEQMLHIVRQIMAMRQYGIDEVESSYLYTQERQVNETRGCENDPKKWPEQCNAVQGY